MCHVNIRGHVYVYYLFSTVGETEEEKTTVYMLLDQVMNMRDIFVVWAYIPDVVSHRIIKYVNIQTEN